ncbi:MAG: phenylalanine--tRNA ligase subunit beta [Cyclobacteriaceae bacterium]|nr:phenylalanine--tRNA ligase subunit beta [Cyclobacteriaceae bacterium]
MKISLSWLKDFLDLHENAEEIGNLLTRSGLEVEGIEEYEQVKGNLQGVVIGHVVDCQPHPNADKLSITRVDIGDGELKPIVCGAPNVAQGQKVLVATTGTTLYPANNEPFTIKKAKIRGEVSEGMICAEDELGLGESHDGILVLDTDLPIGTPASDYLKLSTDLILEIGLTPNRADAASHMGVARDLKALYKKELSMPALSAFKTDKIDRPVEVTVENTEACPRYSGLTIRGLSVKDSPSWLQNRLKAIGLSPINNVVDITNYVLHELGQPLHAFDADKIKGNKVIVKTLPQNTIFTSLDEKERKLSAQDLMICDAEEGMCIAGVFGGIHSGVSESTTSIFLESAYFSADYIRRTSMLHGLKTDASFRFERGTDPNMTVFALKRAALLIVEIAGGEICSEISDIYPKPIADHRIQAKYKNIDRLIGKKIERNQILEILQWLDIKIEKQSEEGFSAVVPPYRVDITREADLIEEILRIYGYDNIELSDRLASDYLANFPEKDAHKSRLRFSELLAANGFYEIYTNSLTREGFSEKIGSFSPEADVKILNKLSEELGVMRQSLVFTGLDVVAYNINRKQKDLKLFEFGRVYSMKGKGVYREKDMLAIWLTGLTEPSNWINPERKTQFHDIYTAAFKIVDKFVGDDYESVPFQDGVFQYGLEIRINGKTYVRLGRLRKEVCRLAEIEQEVFYAEVDFQALLEDIRKTFTFKEISRFPEVYRDLSLVIEKSVTFEQIKDITRKKEFRLLQKVNVFDYYEGENIGYDKKAYALTFTLQDEDKTLTDKTIDKTMHQLMQTFERELGATIRK